MASPGTDLEALLARQGAVSLAVQALLEHLLASGVLTPPDLVQLREFGLQVADDLQAHGATGAQVGGARLDAEIRAWWHPLGVPASTERTADKRQFGSHEPD